MITTLLASVLLFAGGCSDNFDDSALWKGVDEIYNQLTELRKTGRRTQQPGAAARVRRQRRGRNLDHAGRRGGNNVVRYKGADNVEHSVTVATKNDVTTAPILGTKEEGGVLYWTTTAGGQNRLSGKTPTGSKYPSPDARPKWLSIRRVTGPSTAVG